MRDEGVAIELLVSTKLEGSVYLESWVIKGTVTSLLVESIKIEKNNIGEEIQVDGIADTLNFLIGMALPAIDKQILGPGIPLPSVEGIDLSQSSIKSHNGYILVQATPEYKRSQGQISFS